MARPSNDLTDYMKGKKGMRENMPSVLELIVAVFFLAILPAQLHALTPNQVFDKVKDSIVVVKTIDAESKIMGQGSGVLISTGRVATNCHVIQGGTSYQVIRGKEFASAILYAEDGDKDICILDISDTKGPRDLIAELAGGFPKDGIRGITGKPAQLGKAASLKVGVPVYAVGAPQGLELSLSDGIVAQLRGGPPPLIQTTAAISPGSSGGGLFDGEGRLVGLTTLYLKEGQSLNFAMPVEWIGEIKPLRNLLTITDKIKPSRDLVTETRGQIEWFKHTIALEELKDWQGMLDWCQKWTKNEPTSDNAWHSLGIAYGKLGHVNYAIDAFRQALSINPRYDHAWFSLGIGYDKLNRYNEAIEAYRQALRINPEYADVWSYLGYAYVELKRYNDAILACREALRLKPENNPFPWGILARAYDDLKRYNDAIEAYHQALRTNPETDVVWFHLGVDYSMLNRYNDAIDAFRQALSINPEYADAWSYLGTSYGELKRYKDAIEAYRQALRIDPEDTYAWYNLGGTYANSGNRTAALEVIQRLRRLDPAQADKLFNLIVPR